MKKELVFNGKKLVVTSVEEILALGMKLSEMVAAHNELVAAEAQVKKFTDKTVAAKRLLAVLPEAPAVTTTVTASKTLPGSVKTILRGLYTNPAAAFTLEELLDHCGCTKKVLMDDIARLKNPAYAGKSGTLVIVKRFGLYVNEETVTVQTVEDGTEGDNSLVDMEVEEAA